MVFTIFTFIVFISQLIIAFAIIIWLLKFDKSIREKSLFLEEAKPKIKEIAGLARGISEQLAELTPMWVENFRKVRNKILLAKFESILSALLFWRINIKLVRKIRKSKFLKAVFKGLSMFQYMV